MAVRSTSGWRIRWSSRTAPIEWDATGATLARSAQWTRARDGVEYAELSLAGAGEAWRTKVIVARIDPRVLRLSLDTAIVDARAVWNIARLKRDELFAVNAGQFAYTLPWGWVVLNGKQFLPPGTGPLSSAFVIDSSGTVCWLHGAVSRAAPCHPERSEGSAVSHAAWAFQSYPSLLRDGRVPDQLRAPTPLLDLSHRDARAAIGQDREGRIVVAITRFDAFGQSFGFVPFGLTTPEMAAVMGALGARDAVALDGGISAQLAIRNADGSVLSWRGMRSVPLALVARSR